MGIELGAVFEKMGQVIAERVGNFRRGHTAAEEADVRRIASGDIFPKDTARYLKERLDSAARLSPAGDTMINPSPLSNVVDAVLTERKRLDALSKKQLADEVRKNAVRKYRDWNLSN